MINLKKILKWASTQPKPNGIFLPMAPVQRLNDSGFEYLYSSLRYSLFPVFNLKTINTPKGGVQKQITFFKVVLI